MARINAVSFHENPSLEAICRAIRAAGFDSIELSRPRFYDMLTTPETQRRFADWTRELGLSLYGFDCWVEVDPYNRFDETLADFRRVVTWAADMNLGMLITHDPWASVNGHRTPSQCLKTCRELFSRVVELCGEKQITLVFEPHPDTLSMCDSWAIDFIDHLGMGQSQGSVGILYDCAHYGVGQPTTYPGAIARLGSRIRHVHFSDGDSRTYALHLPLGDGTLDLAAIIAALAAVRFDGTLTNDLFNYPLLEDGARRNAPRIRDVERQLGISRTASGAGAIPGDFPVARASWTKAPAGDESSPSPPHR
jgi:sugar phosphate isomerase/epimerase